MIEPRKVSKIWLHATKIYFRKAKNQLIETKRQSRGVSLKLKFHHLERSLLEAVLARGDRRLSRVLETAYQNGACFDAWNECFDNQRYLEAFRQCQIDPAFYAHRCRDRNEILPWDHLAGGNRDMLHRQLQRILKMLEP